MSGMEKSEMEEAVVGDEGFDVHDEFFKLIDNGRKVALDAEVPEMPRFQDVTMLLHSIC